MRKCALILLLLASVLLAQNGEVVVTQLFDGAEPLETYAEYLARRTPYPISTPEPLPVYSAGNGPGDELFILINEDLYPLIESSFTTYANQLAGLGYGVNAYTSGIPSSPELLKSWIVDWWENDGLDGLILIGDYDSAWFQGIFWPDIGYEEFPCDLFLTDLDGDWQDNEDSSGAPNPDGIYDYHEAGSGDIETDIYLGRLPAHNLTMFNGEADLVNAWLERMIDYRNDACTVPRSSMTYVDHDWQSSGNSWSAAVAQVYANNEKNVWPNVDGNGYMDRLDTVQYEHILMCCHSSPAIHQFHDGPSVNNYYVNSTDHEWLVHNLFACSNARYTTDNNMGAVYVLDNDGQGLLTIGSTKTGSMLFFNEFYSEVAVGATWGEAFQTWFALVAEGYGWADRPTARGWFYGMTLIGDPTMLPSDNTEVQLVDLTAEPTAEGALISWDVEADDAVCNLYRIDNTGFITDGANVKLNERPLEPAHGRFLDREAAGPTAYRLEVIEPGGQSTSFGPVECDLGGISDAVTRIVGVNPSPSRGWSAVTFELADNGPAELALYDLAGRRITVLHSGNLAAGRHVIGLDAAPLPAGLYLIRLQTAAVNATSRLVVDR
jgi:hypothetical protein